MTFRIIDKKTGKEPTERVINNIAEKYRLVMCDIDQFAVCEDGSIILLDDCGNIAYFSLDRFEIRIENPLENSIIERLERLKGNWGSDYHKNGYIDDCISEIRKIFKELNNG